jgi:type IV pilus assembly protein PilM
MTERIVGLDIGRDRIRAVEIENPRKPRPTVVRAQEIVLPDGAVRSGEVRELQTVASALRRLWSDGGFKSKDVVLGMGNQRVLARDLTVPKMPLADIRASLPFQVQDLLPVPVADAILDFYPISDGMGENGPVVNGLLIAAIKDAVNANVQAVRMAGLRPAEVDLIPFALTRLMAGSSNGEVIVLVDIGGTTTNVVVSVRGVPEFVRIIPTGGDDITKAIAARMGITAVSAENLKRSSRLGRGGVLPEERQAVEVLGESSFELLNSLRNTINYYVNAHPEHRPARIVMTGGGALLSGLTDVLAEMTHTPVTIGNPFEHVTVARALGKAKAQEPAAFTVALGLALGSAA